MLTVSQQLRAVESKLDLDSDSTDAEDCMWSGEELTVVGTGLTLAEGIVPIMDDGRFGLRSQPCGCTSLALSGDI